MPIALSNHRYFSLLIIALLALALSACGERERDVDKAAQEGIMLIGNGSEPKSIDPHLVTGVTENQIIQTMVEGLIAYHPDDDTVPYPGVAQSWESNDDFTVWTFKLRDNAKWSNGDPVVASDFVYSWERILSPALGAEYAEMLYVIDNAAAFHQGEISDFGAVGVKALDDYTLQVTLEGSTPYFLSMLKHYSFYPVNPKVVEEFGGMTNRQSGWSTVENFVGNGPFQITAWNTNDFLEVERNPYYWDADNVGLNGIRFLPIENLNTEHTAFQGGRLHVTYEVPADRIPRLRDAND
ncbi:MAG: peptide ABC transporter substrate-binding protein, partial [Pseudomonadota bacterium]